MRIEVADRGDDGILSFKAETAAERLQLDFILQKATDLHLAASPFRDGMMTVVEFRS